MARKKELTIDKDVDAVERGHEGESGTREHKPVEAITAKPRKTEGERYRLKNLMNVRERPSMEAAILGTIAEGTAVDVLKVEDDWLCLADGSFILYGGGRWAEKA